MPNLNKLEQFLQVCISGYKPTLIRSMEYDFLMKNLSEWNESSSEEKYNCAKKLYEFAQKPNTDRSSIGRFFNENDIDIADTLFKEALKMCPEESLEQQTTKAKIYKHYGDFLVKVCQQDSSYYYNNPAKIINLYQQAERLDDLLPKDTFQKLENARVRAILFDPDSKKIPKDKDLSRCKLLFPQESKTNANIVLKKALIAYESRSVSSDVANTLMQGAADMGSELANVIRTAVRNHCPFATIESRSSVAISQKMSYYSFTKNDNYLEFLITDFLAKKSTQALLQE
jgi:hypothetical protein